MNLTDEYLIELRLSGIDLQIPYEDYVSNINPNYTAVSIFITPHNFDKLIEHKHLLRVEFLVRKIPVTNASYYQQNEVYILNNCYFNITKETKHTMIAEVTKCENNLYEFIIKHSRTD